MKIYPPLCLPFPRWLRRFRRSVVHDALHASIWIENLRNPRNLRENLPVMLLPPHPVPHSEPWFPQSFARVIDHHAGITHQALDVRSQLRLGGTTKQSLVILPEVATSHHLPHELLIIALARHGVIAITDSCLSPYFFVMCRKRVIRRSKLLSLLSM